MRLVVNGAYDWVLTAQPADGHGRALVRTGKVDIAYAAPAWRDFGGRDGLGDLFVVVEDQSLGMRRGKLPGTVGPYGGYWGILDAPATGIVPTGDLRGDRCNDYLVVNSDGSLYRLDGTCDDDGQYGFLTDPVKIGTGWKAYDVYSPGDLNGDGVADVLARQKSTGSLYLYASNGAGKLTAGVLIGTGWKSLTVVAAGDLTGDGIGDVLARDSSGVLWRYSRHGRREAGRQAADRLRLGPVQRDRGGRRHHGRRQERPVRPGQGRGAVAVRGHGRRPVRPPREAQPRLAGLPHPVLTARPDPGDPLARVRRPATPYGTRRGYRIGCRAGDGYARGVIAQGPLAQLVRAADF